MSTPPYQNPQSSYGYPNKSQYPATTDSFGLTHGVQQPAAVPQTGYPATNQPGFPPPNQQNYPSNIHSSHNYPVTTTIQGHGYPPSVSPNNPPSNQSYPSVNSATSVSNQGYPSGAVHPSSVSPGFPPPNQGYPTVSIHPSSVSPGYPLPNQGYPPANSSSGTSVYNQGYPSGVPIQQSRYLNENHQYGGQPQGPTASVRVYNSPPTTGSCTSKVELRISCKNLLDRDTFSKSDPMVAVYIKVGHSWYQLGRTENIKNCLNPEFQKAVIVDYNFEEVQQIRFEVYDLDNHTPELSDDDFLGRTECSLGQIVSSKCVTRPLLSKRGNKAGNGSITICADEYGDESKEIFQLTFAGRGLDKKDFLGKSDPYLELRRKMPNGDWVLFTRTEVVKNNLNPCWRPLEISKKALCGGNLDCEIKITCNDYDNDGSHDLIGECTTSLTEMKKCSSQQVTWTLINAKKRAKKGKSYRGSGNIILSSCKSVRIYSFLDYIMSGTRLNFIVAVDFTASNGNPHNPQSLHFIDPSQPNEYMKAIMAVGSVIQDYDSDKMFPALGFGAKIPPSYQLSHEFALNFNLQNPFCAGLDSLIQTYQDCIRQVQLYGPTNVSPVIYHAAKFAQHAHQQIEPQDYFVLLMLTDGVITDMDETRKAIVHSSRLPLSIIIVGVGNADFGDMNVLDGDDGLLRAPDGTPVFRDIVQFVPFRKFSNTHPSFLAKEVLAEVPKQLTQYYKSRGIKPKQIPE